MALQPGVSTVAFSGSLAVLGTLGDCSTGDLELTPTAAAAAAAAAAGGRPTSGGAAAGRAAGNRRQQGGLPGGRLLAGAAGTSAAAAAARAPRSSSTTLGDEAAPRRTAVSSRRAAAVAAAVRITAGSVTVPESDTEDADDEDADDDVLLVEDGREAAAAANGVRAVGRASAAARGRAADGSSGSNGRDSEQTAAGSSDGEDAGDAAAGRGLPRAAKPLCDQRLCAGQPAAHLEAMALPVLWLATPAASGGSSSCLRAAGCAAGAVTTASGTFSASACSRGAGRMSRGPSMCSEWRAEPEGLHLERAVALRLAGSRRAICVATQCACCNCLCGGVGSPLATSGRWVWLGACGVDLCAAVFT
ncbi:hypothetical protein COO60DRAFT_762501 [Scenedesmus sp. NREL 46B-D3]|nr:hypothetical protein COO60DRAFT_762501 [Scenedesmus sp. NREL 46B-D3]